MDLSSVLDVIPAIAGALTAAAPIAAIAGRKIRAMSRTIAALSDAVNQFDAQNRGVVLVLSYPNHPRSAIPLLKQAGWTVCPYNVPAGSVLPSTDQFWADLAVADVVLLEGGDESSNTILAGTERFRHTLGPGAAVVAFTPSHLVRYKQELWGDGDQSVTTPATAEAAVRSAVARRRHIQALQGVRPGGLAAAKAAL